MSTVSTHEGEHSTTRATCVRQGCQRPIIYTKRRLCGTCYKRLWRADRRRATRQSFPRLARDARAEKIRKWLAFGHQTLDELAQAMGCSRFALHHTLSMMPDIETATVKIVRLAKRPASAQRFA